jgi:hypothetical protein
MLEKYTFKKIQEEVGNIKKMIEKNIAFSIAIFLGLGISLMYFKDDFGLISILLAFITSFLGIKRVNQYKKIKFLEIKIEEAKKEVKDGKLEEKRAVQNLRELASKNL